MRGSSGRRGSDDASSPASAEWLWGLWRGYRPGAPFWRLPWAAARHCSSLTTPMSFSTSSHTLDTATGRLLMAAEAAVRCRGARESVADQLHRSGLWDRGRSPPLLTPTNLCSVGMYLVWQVALSRGATAWCLFAAPSPRRVSWILRSRSVTRLRLNWTRALPTNSEQRLSR